MSGKWKVFVRGCDEEIEVSGSVDPGDPGQTSGPPERCWPPEPASAEIEEAWVQTGKGRVDLAAFPDGLLRDGFWEDLEEAVMDAAWIELEASEDARAEAMAEAWEREREWAELDTFAWRD